MLNNQPIIRYLFYFIAPYIILYALYIQLNGEVSPGGGFQAGVIFASALVALELVIGSKAMSNYLPTEFLAISSAIGVAIYAGVGFYALFNDQNFLNYNVLSSNEPIAGQHLGIFIIEAGIGLTVATVMYLLYSLLKVDES